MLSKEERKVLGKYVFWTEKKAPTYGVGCGESSCGQFSCSNDPSCGGLCNTSSYIKSIRQDHETPLLHVDV